MTDSGKTIKSADSPKMENLSEPTSRDTDRPKDTVQIFKEIKEDIDIVIAQIGSPKLRKMYKTRLTANVGFLACMLKSYEDRYGE